MLMQLQVRLLIYAAGQMKFWNCPYIFLVGKWWKKLIVYRKTCVALISPTTTVFWALWLCPALLNPC